MFQKKDINVGPVDQYGRPLNASEPKRSAEDDKRIIIIFFVVLIVLAIIVVSIILVLNHSRKNRLEIPTATLSTSDWTRDSVIVTIDKSRGNVKEFSFDGGKTWQESNELIVEENKELTLQVRNSSGKVSKAATILVSNIDTTSPRLSFIDSYIVVVGSKFDPKQNVAVSDDESGIDEYTVDTSSLDLSTPGVYTISYYLSDLVGNETKKDRKIIVEAETHLYQYRSRSVEIVEGQCENLCQCISRTEDTCPVGTTLSVDQTKCCQVCIEDCLKPQYGEWSEWQDEKILPSFDIEVEMRSVSFFEDLSIVQ